MSIFSSFFGGYNRPGPGVRPDEPRKKGFIRLLEILGRDVELEAEAVPCGTIFAGEG